MSYAKALVPSVVAVMLYLLSFAGVTPEMSLQDVLTLAVTSGLVWLTPNKESR